MQGKRALRRVRLTTATAVAAVALSGCLGSPSAPSDWRHQAEQVLGSATTGLGTARLVLDGVRHDRLTRAYAVVALTDTVQTTRQDVDAFAGGQPPDELHALHHAVLEELDAAALLLADIRVAVTAGASRTALAALADRAGAELDALAAVTRAASRSAG